MLGITPETVQNDWHIIVKIERVDPLSRKVTHESKRESKPEVSMK